MAALKPNQIKAAMLLAAGKTGREVASAINCTPETISHWRQSLEFRAFFNDLRWDALEAGREALRAGTREAVEGLLKLVRHAEHEETQRKACIDVLELTGFRDTTIAAYGSGLGPRTANEVYREVWRRAVEKRMFRGPVDEAVDKIMEEKEKESLDGTKFHSSL